GCEIGAVVDGYRGDGTVLRQSDCGFIGDLGLGGRGVDDKDQGLAGAVGQIDGGADGAPVVRAGRGRDDDQLGDSNNALDSHGDGRWRVDDGQAEALLTQDLEI